MLRREEQSHKGENGKVAVIGGSKDFTGAPALSAKAALRTGCDLVKIVTSEKVSNIVASYSENFIVREYPSDYLQDSGIEEALQAIKWSDAAVIGPGLGDPDQEALDKIVSRAQKPLIIDADAIKPALEADLAEAVFTPHSAEAKVIEQKYGSVEKFAKKGSTVIVTGPKDIIYTSENVLENETGSPAMTVGGTGDVLTGIIASLISQGLQLEEAAKRAAEINGKGGELAAEEYGNGALAEDIIDKIPKIMKK